MRYIFTSVILFITVPLCVNGYFSYCKTIPNGNNVVVNGTNWPGVGHLSDSGGGERNSFGLAFAAAGHTWTPDFCAADSDGDGYSNGMELGDPDCIWVPGDTPSRTTDISHPGIASSIPMTTTEATTTTTAPPTTSGGDGLTADVDILTGMKAGWGLCAGRSDDACGGPLSTASDQNSVLVTLQFPSVAGTWAGMGFAETSMAGHAVVCALADEIATRVVCMLYQTIAYGAIPQIAISLIQTQHTPNTVVDDDQQNHTFAIFNSVSNNSSNGTTIVTFRIDSTLLNISSARVSAEKEEGAYRAIFSMGSFNETLMSDVWTAIDATPTKRITTFTSPIYMHTSRTVIDITFIDANTTTTTATTTASTTTGQTTTTTTTTSAPTNGGDGTTATFQVLNDLKAGWGLCAGRRDDACGGPLSTASDQNSVLVTLQFPSTASWGSMGFSETSMMGSAVACSLADDDAGRPVCILLQTYNYGVTPQRAVSMLPSPSSLSSSNVSVTFTVVSSSQNLLGTTITFRIDRSLVAASDGAQRSIFAKGAFDVASMSALWSSIEQSGSNSVSSSFIPQLLHRHTERGSALINLAKSNAFDKLGKESFYSTVTYIVVGVTLVVIALAVQFVYRLIDPLAGSGPITNMIAHGSMAAILLVILPVTVLLLMKRHYVDSRETVPWFRAVGEVAKYGFFLVLLPVCHRVSLPAIFLRTTYERSSGMHAALGIFILLAVTVHGVGMSLKGVESLSDITKPDTPKRNLYGLLAWITLVLVSIPAMLRGRGIPRMFATFRVTHILVILVIVFACIHNPGLTLVMIPGVVMYLGDLIWRAYEVFFVNRKACVVAAEYNAHAGVTAIQLTCRGVHRDTRVDEALVQAAGKHVLIRIKRLGLLPHPLSIALTDPSQGIVTIFVKNTGEDASSPLPLSHRWTERLAAMATSSAQDVFNVFGGTPSTEEEGDAARGPKIDVAVLGLLSSSAVVPLEILLGHYGVTHASTTHIHIVLMAGGIGITPIVSYLQALAGLSTTTTVERGEGGKGLPVRQLSVTVVWSVRDDGMRAYFEPLLQQLVGGIGSHILLPNTLLPLCRSGGGQAVMEVKSLSLHVFQTGGGGGEDAVRTTPPADAVEVVAKVRKWGSSRGKKDDSLLALNEHQYGSTGGETTGLVCNDGAARRDTPKKEVDASSFLPSNCNTPKSPSFEPISTTNHKGRPDLETLRTIILNEGENNTTDAGAVYACGPAGVMGVAKELARKTGLLYHYEVFE